MEFFSDYLQHSITFFAILDPIGVSAVALALLGSNLTNSQISAIAFKSTLTIIIAFFVVLSTGELILKLFGIDENSLKVMGGIVLILMAISMVNGTASKVSNKDNKAGEELAIIPIGIPVVFGAGLFTTIVIFKHQSQTFLDLLSISLAFCTNALFYYLIMKNSHYVKKYLGVTGQNVVTKLMGLIVGAIAVQFIVGGIVHLGKDYLGA